MSFTEIVQTILAAGALLTILTGSFWLKSFLKGRVHHE